MRAGSPWRLLPTNLPPWPAVYQQTQRWIAAGVFEDIFHDLRELLRVAQGRAKTPTAVIFDSQTKQSTPKSGDRAGWDGAKRKKGTKLHIAVDTLGNPLALIVNPANERLRACAKQDRDQVHASMNEVAQLACSVQEVTGSSVKLAFVDQGYTGEEAEKAAKQHGMRLEVVKLPEAKRGFVLLPRRWVHKCVDEVVERSFAWATRFRRLVRDYERLPETVAGLHFAVFALLMLARLVTTQVQSA